MIKGQLKVRIPNPQIDFYIELLSYVKGAYTGQFLHAKPSEIATHWKKNTVDHIQEPQKQYN